MNKRTIYGGIFLVVVAVAFFLYMLTLRAQSNDPVEMMRLVGQTSGVVAGIGLVLIVLGYLGVGAKKKVASDK